MDPDETYRLWCKAVAKEDREAACDAAKDLIEWLSSGGFSPMLFLSDEAVKDAFWKWVREELEK